MDNLWLLTEERPKLSVIIQIINMYCEDFNDEYYENSIHIVPIFENKKFTFTYKVEGLFVNNANNIFIKTVSGSSSFIDFLLFKQENEPTEGNTEDNLIMAIEETKTNDDESRNTGVYQRGSKFVFITPYYSNVKLYMLYNEELEAREDKKPSDTSVFGTNILLTLGVTVIGKDVSKWFGKFNTLDDLIAFKANMRKPPQGNVPITIVKDDSKITISGRLAKPADAGNIGHDPNIGALSMIAACIRKLGWDKPIIITMHGVSQEYVNKTKGKNKFLYICDILNMQLSGIEMPAVVSLPEQYWHYEFSSEKMASILLHLSLLYKNCYTVYENHAGCERGYFKDLSGNQITLPKKATDGNNLLIPDVVIYNELTKDILLVEGKKLSTMYDGINEIKLYDRIEEDYIKKFYPDSKVLRCVSIFGGKRTGHLHDDVLIYLNEYGEIYLNPKSPSFVIDAFNELAK